MSIEEKINCVVIVNDPVEIEIFQMALENIDLLINFTFFTNFHKAIETFKKKEMLPDCIIIDSDIGVIERKECLAEIKTIDHVLKVPVIIFSGLLSDLEMAILRELGAHGFIPKANSINELKNNLTTFFNSEFDHNNELGV